MKKVLFVATVTKMHIELFHIPYLKWFKENGYEVHVCARNDYAHKANCHIPYCDQHFDLPFERSPLNINNISVYKNLKKIIQNNDYDLIHCHTPMGGVLARLAAKEARRRGTKVVYTAHGFHFYKGSPLKNWLLYYPVEKWLSRKTDLLITINEEDYIKAKKKFNSEVAYIPGIGVDTKHFAKNIKNSRQLKQSFGIKEKQIVLTSVGELSKRKNHEVIIEALSKLKNLDIVYLICGEGDLKDYLKKKAEDLKVKVIFLGFVDDVSTIYNLTDVFIFPSRQEGLPVALMEAMSAQLPIICSDIRGNTDLVKQGEGGYLISPDDVLGFRTSIAELAKDNDKRISMGLINKEVVKKFDVTYVNDKMVTLYEKVLGS